jgi:hypothetical protein
MCPVVRHVPFMVLIKLEGYFISITFFCLAVNTGQPRSASLLKRRILAQTKHQQTELQLLCGDEILLVVIMDLRRTQFRNKYVVRNN